MLLFDRSCKQYIADQNAMTALKSFLEKLKSQNKEDSLPFEKPLVVSVQYVGGVSLTELAEEYYANGSLASFTAIFSSLPDEVQKSFGDRMFTDGKIAFFSAVLKKMDNTMENVYVNRAYQEDKLTFFASAAPYFTEDAKRSWIVRCSCDKRNTYLAVLTR